VEKKNMKQFFICILLCLLQFNLSAQIQSSELGIEAFGGGSQLGGTLGGELKYAVKLPNNLIIGPSLRLHRSWSNYLNVNSQFNMYGGGAFAHLRYQDKIFAGVEFQMLHSPFNLNLALFYDVINADNSPFRSSYNFKIKNEFGQVVRILPIIYRITLFIPLSK
jgi:hypothetical protein